MNRTIQREKEKQKKMRMSVDFGSFVIGKAVMIIAKVQNINTLHYSVSFLHESSFD